jgi:hypothetical protein
VTRSGGKGEGSRAGKNTSKAFFSEEKKQKTFTSGAHGQIQAMAGKLGAAQE